MACQSRSVEAILMSVYIVTGKLGNGKTLVTVGRIKEGIEAGVRIATNLDLNLKEMFHRKANGMEVIRIPDKPNIDDLNAIGAGHVGKYDESKFGILVLDECGSWFNSRNWQDKSRKEVIEWFLHARKLRWHVYLIVQDIKLLDSQARDALAEFTVYCRRLDNIRVPLIGGLVKTLTGHRLTLPRVHRAKVCYVGDDIISDVWHYRGNDLFTSYQTDQLFLADYPHAPHCLLTPWHVYGRNAVPMSRKNIMRITKIYWRRFKSPVALSTGLLLGAFAGFLRFATPAPIDPVTVNESGSVIEQTLVSESSDIPPVLRSLQQMRITGTYSVNNDIRYQFNNIEEPEGHYITDQDLSQAGITLAKRSSCRVDAYYADAQVSIFCM